MLKKKHTHTHTHTHTHRQSYVSNALKERERKHMVQANDHHFRKLSDVQPHQQMRDLSSFFLPSQLFTCKTAFRKKINKNHEIWEEIKLNLIFF